jgi:hypothetical protein
LVAFVTTAVDNEAAGIAFPTYNEAVAKLAATMREQGSIDQNDVDRLCARMSPRA